VLLRFHALFQVFVEEDEEDKKEEEEEQQ